MNHIKKCFLLSARALSLEWCERDLVNSISSFSSSSAPRLLMYSEPLSEGPFSIGVQVAGWAKNRRVGVLKSGRPATRLYRVGKKHGGSLRRGTA